MEHSGILVAIEGIDGAGKTKQVTLLRDALSRAGEIPVVSREPTNGKWGRLIRESAITGRMSPEDELDAFIKDRTEHFETLVGPALERNETVILDRYFYSSIAYQGSRGANVQEVESIMKSRFPIPDAVYIIDVDPFLSVHRIAHSRGEEPNQFEDRKNLARAREIFKSMRGPNIHHVDGSMPAEAVHAEIINNFVEGVFRAKRCAKPYGCDDPLHCTFRMSDACAWARMASVIRQTGGAVPGR